MAAKKKTLTSQRKPRIGVYLSCEASVGEQYQRSLSIVEALEDYTDKYAIYVYSPYKIWKQYCRKRPLDYRPFPTSGASNFLGRFMFRKYLTAPDPPEWLGEMLARKAVDEKLIVLIFPTASSMAQQISIPVITAADLDTALSPDKGLSPVALSKELMTMIKAATYKQPPLSDSPHNDSNNSDDE